MNKELQDLAGYSGWPADLEQRIQSVQQIVLLAVNREPIVQQLVRQLPWFHLCALIDDAKGVTA